MKIFSQGILTCNIYRLSFFIGFCFCGYVAVALVLNLMVSHTEMNGAAALADAFSKVKILHFGISSVISCAE